MSRALARVVPVTVMVLAAVGVGGGAAHADPVSSCAGVLAMNANPNNGFIIHEIEKPLAEELGITMGALQSSIAHTRGSTIEECIP